MLALTRLDIGDTFVAGKDQPTAAALLAACDELGLDQAVVRTVDGGFVVPDEVWDQAAKNQTDHEAF